MINIIEFGVQFAENDFRRAFTNLSTKFGFTDIILPFLLIFTIIFAVLEKTKILGEEKRSMNIGIAIVLALMTVIPHVTNALPPDRDPVKIINNAIPKVSLFVVAIIFLMILLGVFAHDRLLLGVSAPGWVAFISVFALIYIFGSAAGIWTPQFIQRLEGTFGSDVISVVIMIVIFGIIIAFVTGGGEREGYGAFRRAGINLGELFGGRR